MIMQGSSLTEVQYTWASTFVIRTPKFTILNRGAMQRCQPYRMVVRNIYHIFPEQMGSLRNTRQCRFVDKCPRQSSCTPCLCNRKIGRTRRGQSKMRGLCSPCFIAFKTGHTAEYSPLNVWILLFFLALLRSFMFLESIAAPHVLLCIGQETWICMSLLVFKRYFAIRSQSPRHVRYGHGAQLSHGTSIYRRLLRRTKSLLFVIHKRRGIVHCMWKQILMHILCT